MSANRLRRLHVYRRRAAAIPATVPCSFTRAPCRQESSIRDRRVFQRVLRHRRIYIYTHCGHGRLPCFPAFCPRRRGCATTGLCLFKTSRANDCMSPAAGGVWPDRGKSSASRALCPLSTNSGIPARAGSFPSARRRSRKGNVRRRRRHRRLLDVMWTNEADRAPPTGGAPLATGPCAFQKEGRLLPLPFPSLQSRMPRRGPREKPSDLRSHPRA